MSTVLVRYNLSNTALFRVRFYDFRFVDCSRISKSPSKRMLNVTIQWNKKNPLLVTVYQITPHCGYSIRILCFSNVWMPFSSFFKYRFNRRNELTMQKTFSLFLYINSITTETWIAFFSLFFHSRLILTQNPYYLFIE